MSKSRLEAFSDGVLAIIITIMVLELKVPEGHDLDALRERLPVFLSYVLSFVMVGIYWNNHHHLLQAASQVNGRILWANMHLLFWLSLMPAVTAWMGDSDFATIPVAVYGIDLWACAVAYYLLAQALVAHHGPGSTLAAALGRDTKGRISLVAYTAAVPLAFVTPWFALAVFVAIAALWIVPDRRIERSVGR